MVEPYRSTSPSRAGLLGRLPGRRARARLERELWELLAAAGRIREVSPDVVDEICARNGADPYRDLDVVRGRLYGCLLEHCLLDCALSAEERGELAHLRLLLRLSEREASEVHDRVARAVYGEALDRVLEDHRCDPEEEDFLRRLREELRLSAEAAEGLREKAARRARDRFVSSAAVHDHMYVTPRQAVIELEGGSRESLEDAVRDAVERASETLDGLTEAELAEARVVLDGGSVREWRVKVRAKVPRTDSAGA